MGVRQDRSYFRERAVEEQEAAAHASCMVKDVHLELAELYGVMAEPALPSEGDDTPKPVR